MTKIRNNAVWSFEIGIEQLEQKDSGQEEREHQDGDGNERVETEAEQIERTIRPKNDERPVGDIEVSHHSKNQGYTQGDNAVEQAVKNSVSQRLKHRNYLPTR